MRKANPDTHQLCRSLLQKAVRRGCHELVEVTARHLGQIGDFNWLRRRAGVIVFEECWPLGVDLNEKLELAEIIAFLVKTGNSVKYKDAAGLGAMAYELSKGDTSMVAGSEDKAIRLIAKAIQEPQSFWNWIDGQIQDASQTQLVSSAKRAYKRGGWPWDRAFMQAAAYLATRGDIPSARLSSRPNIEMADFPYWTAIDKHTEQGKAALREFASKRHVSYRQLAWANFYFESARENEEESSMWWEREKTWRLGKAGLSVEGARALWEEVRQEYADSVQKEATNLKIHILQMEHTTASTQLPLFNLGEVPYDDRRSDS